ncbi:MAG TPA: hypothetical protein DCZ94_19405 [Lentisphaeria bacterium]|nr:MAG: hypothetical protein A2X48_07550 [Lentisphaerae bacterium GWF2_49_21]HBC89111.1 hypothetical protein [Lentisphaeria bacterium]
MKFLFASIFSVICLSAISADNLPLYRMGLEKWEPDHFRAVVIYGTENSAGLEQGIAFLEGRTRDRVGGLNLVVGKADIKDRSIIDKRTSEILRTFKPDRFPFTIIYFPQVSDVDIPLWAGYLTVQAGELICDSPARREIARRILKGEWAVWLFIKSGNEEKDGRALQILSDELKAAPAAGTPGEDSSRDAILPGLNHARMSIIMVSRDDKSELILLEMLNCIEPEIMSAGNEPVIAPVYGRGRVLDIFSGDEISGENLRKNIRMLEMEQPSGIKQPASGADLLIAVNWTAFIRGELHVDKDLPSLKPHDANDVIDSAELLPMPDENVSVPDLDPRLSGPADAPPASTPFQLKVINIVLVGIIVLLATLFIAIVLRVRK